MLNFNKKVYLYIFILIFVFSINVSAKTRLKEFFDFGINIFTYSFSLNELDYDDFASLIKNNEKIDVQAELIVNYIFYSEKTPLEALDILEEDIARSYLEGEAFANSDFLFTFTNFLYLYFNDDNKLTYYIDSLREISLIKRVHSNDPWIYIISSMIQYFYSRTSAMEDYEIDYYENIEYVVQSDHQDAKVSFAIGNFFKKTARNNPSAHKLAVIQFQKAVHFASDDTVLKIVALKKFISIMEIYKTSFAEVPVWLEELIYQYTIKVDPNDPYAYNNLAFLYITRTDKTKEGLELAKDAYEMRKGDANILDTLAYAYFANGDFDKARKFFEKAYSVEPDNKKVLKHISDFYLVLDQREIAKKYLKKYIKLEPADFPAMNNLAYLLAILDKELDYALELITEVIENASEPDNVYYDTWGWILYKKGEYDKARGILEKIQSYDDAEILIHKAFLYTKLEEYDKGLEYFRKVIKEMPDNDDFLNNYFVLRNLVENNMLKEFEKEFIWMD
ncbi:MAG: tetratricopeptide repeat protein [Candidatus Muiribacteriota bacterium]